MKPSHSNQAAEQQVNARMQKHDLYQILDLTKNSSLPEIKKAYKKLALRYHPDKNRIQQAKQVFNKINNAYLVLSDGKKKLEYDERVREEGGQRKREGKEFYHRRYHDGDSYRKEQFWNQRKYFNEKENRYREQRAREKAEERKRQFQESWEKMQKQYNQLLNKTKMYYNANNQNFKAQQKNKEKQHSQQTKRRQQTARSKKQANQMHTKIVTILFFILIFIAVMLTVLRSNSLTIHPLFSLTSTPIHTFEARTPLLKFPFYVTDRYNNGTLPQHKKQLIHKLVDRKYITELKKDCLAVQNERKDLEEMAYTQKKKKQKKLYRKKAENINDHSCQQFFWLVEMHGEYLENLFQ